MNKKQRISIWVGIIVALLIGIFPRWEGYSQLTYKDYKKSVKTWKQVGIDPNRLGGPHAFELPPSIFPTYSRVVKYRFILTPPKPEVYSETGPRGETVASYRVDFWTLIARWIIVTFITFGAVCSFKGKKGPPLNRQKALDQFLNHIETPSKGP